MILRILTAVLVHIVAFSYVEWFCILCLQAYWRFGETCSCHLGLNTKMETVCDSETLVCSYESTRYNSQEDKNLLLVFMSHIGNLHAIQNLSVLLVCWCSISEVLSEQNNQDKVTL
jgi:hypothetical protein